MSRKTREQNRCHHHHRGGRHHWSSCHRELSAGSKRSWRGELCLLLRRRSIAHLRSQLSHALCCGQRRTPPACRRAQRPQRRLSCSPNAQRHDERRRLPQIEAAMRGTSQAELRIRELRAVNWVFRTSASIVLDLERQMLATLHRCATDNEVGTCSCTAM